MNYRNIILIIATLLLFGCNQTISKKDINFDFDKRYKNSGFALIYNDQLKEIKKLDSRSLSIYHKSIKKKCFRDSCQFYCNGS